MCEGHLYHGKAYPTHSSPIPIALSTTPFPSPAGVALAVSRMCEGHLYYGMSYSRVVDPAGWAAFKAKLLPRLPVPALLRPLAARAMRKRTLGMLWSQVRRGVARRAGWGAPACLLLWPQEAAAGEGTTSRRWLAAIVSN